jgi:hypothetical protein
MQQSALNMQVVSYGGGTDSTAMIVEMLNRGEKIDYITFADTGGERTYTYGYILMFNAWLVERYGVGITIVKKVGMDESLEENCIRKNMLPSLAYGFKGCSQKWKIQPQDKFFNNLPEAKELWKSGGKITKCIGYDLGEERRAKISDDDKYVYRYPLIEWEIEREDSLEIIANAGLPKPGKSACFFCPASRKAEILDLRDNYPDLLNRALKMEENAELTSVKGLGRSFSWKDFLAGQAQDHGAPEQACGCYDG